MGSVARVAWSGHRPELFADPNEARALVFDETRRLVSERGTSVVVLSGGQRGIDLWAAEAARHHGLPLKLLLPAPPDIFSAGWPDDDATIFWSAVEYAEEVVLFGQRVSDSAGYDARNRALAAECDLLVVVWTGLASGGTFFTLTEAGRLGKPIYEHRLGPSGYEPRAGERGI